MHAARRSMALPAAALGIAPPSEVERKEADANEDVEHRQLQSGFQGLEPQPGMCSWGAHGRRLPGSCRGLTTAAAHTKQRSGSRQPSCGDTRTPVCPGPPMLVN